MSELAIGPGLLSQLGERMRSVGLKGRVFVISNDRVFPLYGERALRGIREAGFVAEAYQLPDGEPTKSLTAASALYDWLAAHHAERTDAIVALGGGVVGDVAGFVAATFLRGMPLVQVPTTALAQIDSSIGGKVGVNHPRGKNLIGAFYPARLIVSDTETLLTLSRRELAAGWAEAIKCAMILDAELLDELEVGAEQLLNLASPVGDLALAARIVERSARHKVRVVAEDEREAGLRMILNYGHTIGHALEAATNYCALLHGEAVSIGMAGVAAMSVAMELLDPAVAEHQNRVLERYGLPRRFLPDLPAPPVEAVLSAMASDKKSRAARLNWILLDRLGHAVIRSDVSDTLVRETVEVVLGTGRRG